MQSITPNEWEDFKQLTKQESIRPSEIEGLSWNFGFIGSKITLEPETPVQQTESRFTFEDSSRFEEEYSRHFGKPFGLPETESDDMEVERRDSSEQSASPVPQYADYRKYSEEGSIGYEENEYRIEGKLNNYYKN